MWDDEEEDISEKKRRRKEIDYSDSLTEKEWLKVIGASLDEEANEDNAENENAGGNDDRRGKYKRRHEGESSQVGNLDRDLIKIKMKRLMHDVEKYQDR